MTGRSRIRSFLPTLLLVIPGTALALIARPTPAEATRPLINIGPGIRNFSMSIPMALDPAIDKKKLGLDHEESSVRARTLKQADDYIELRRGRMSEAQEQRWLSACESSETISENPFCKYELNRRPKDSHKIKNGKRELRKSMASELIDGDFARLAGRTHSEIVSAVSAVEGQGKLDDLANAVTELSECTSPAIPTAIAYKLEERFPDPAVVDRSVQLYRKAIACGGKDISTAQANFRLGLVNIWQNKCDEIPVLMTNVETIPAASQYHARAKYWRYFCADRGGHDAAKQLAKDALLKDHPMSFQTLAASGDDETTMAKILTHPEPQMAWRSIIRPDLNGMLRAAEALLKRDAGSLAAEFLDRHVSEIGTVEPEVRLYIAVLLNQTGSALAKFKILSELFQDNPRSVTPQTLKLFFPIWYYDLVKKKLGDVDPLLILSLIRQESAFNSDARSSAGARGLMQVMPGTARSVASVRAQKLYDPAINIGVGTKYFLKRLNQYGGDVELTLAAYNAGFARVDDWKKRYPTDNKLLFLDFIPFRETRDYVSAILRNYYWYVKLYGELPAPNLVAGSKPKIDPKTLAIISANAGAAAAGKLLSK